MGTALAQLAAKYGVDAAQPPAPSSALDALAAKYGVPTSPGFGAVSPGPPPRQGTSDFDPPPSKPGRLRAPTMPATSPTGEIAPADATRRLDPNGQAPNLFARRLTGPAKLGADVFEAGADAISHPLSTAAGLVTAVPEAAYTLGRYTGQQMRLGADRAGLPVSPYAPPGPAREDVSGREALAAGAQLGATALAGPGEGLLERALGKAGVSAGRAALAAKTATGAGVGAAFTPDNPGVGAVLGAAAGAGADRIGRLRGAQPAPPTDPAEAVRARKVADLAAQVRAEGPDGRMSLDLARANAIDAGDMEQARVLADVAAAHDALPRLRTPGAPKVAPPADTPPTTPAAEAPAPVAQAAPEARAPLPEAPPEPVTAPAPPSPGPETIRSAAVRTPDGQVHEDAMHILAVDKANAAGSSTHGGFEEGYVTSAGRFVDRAEAARIAEGASQLRGRVDPSVGLDSKDMGAAGVPGPPRVQAPPPPPATAPTPEPVAAVANEAPRSLADVRGRHPGVEMSVFERPDAKLIRLSRIVVPKDAREQGIGSAAMRDLAAYADATGQRVALTPSTDFGATSVSRLQRFYARFGFKRNTGRSRDLTVSEGMIREPQGTPTASPARLAGGRSQNAPRPMDLYANPVGPALRAASDALHAVLDSEGARALRDSFNRVLDPAARGPEARRAAGVVRAQTGDMARRYERADAALHAVSGVFDRMSDADRLAFIDRVEAGRPQPTPELQQVHDLIRAHLDQTRDAIRALGTGKLDHFIQDYFPHIWDDPAKAKQTFAAIGGRRPMEGPKSFLKKREIPTTADGIAAGLTPVTTNPVDLTLLKLREMQRYLMAQRTIAEMKDKGLARYVKAGQQAPDGYARIDDRIATVFGPRQGAVSLPQGANVAPGDVTVHGQRIMGQYYAPEPVARILNNYLSPGLRGNALFDAYRAVGNTLNQAQLGLSAFHLGVTSLDAAVSRAALGLEQIAHGKPLVGARTLASAPVAPFTNILRGAKVRAEYLKPGSVGGDVAALADMVAEAGGRVRPDSFYGTAAKDFREALRDGRYAKAGVKLLPALLEKTMAPLMEYVVPRQKLGVFGDLAREAVDALPPGADADAVRAALASAWDSVDNRMGQLVYDNLFWDKTVKDLAMASTRSVGWNLGTLRELGGGALDYGRAVAALARGDRPAVTHRMAYLAALPIVVGTYGAVLNVALAGERPQELKDYFFPRTGTFDADGNPNRVQLPSYMRDLFAYAGHPWQTVKHKMAPVLSTVGEMLENQDFYGDPIRNADDPLVKQLAQEAAYLGRTTLPFALRNAQEAGKRGDRPAERAASFVGVTPAPRARIRSDAQNRMIELLGPGGAPSATPDEASARRARADVLGGLRGQGDADAAIREAVDAGALTPTDLTRLMRRARLLPMQERFRRLSLEQALDVFRRADDRERGLFLDLLQQKVNAPAP